MTRFLVAPDGSLSDEIGNVVELDEVDNNRLHVEHLAPYVQKITLPKKGDVVKILVQYSCHCWTETFDETVHEGKMEIMDGVRPRVFSPDRYTASYALSDMFAALDKNQLYLTQSDRNYGVYNATMILDNGTAYTAFFTLKRNKGRFDGIRHALSLYVESAYYHPQPAKGQKVKIAAVIGKALKGEKLKYHRR